MIIAENHVSGIVAPGGRISRNENLYLPQELMRGDGKTIPFYQDHEDFEFNNGKPTGKFSKVQPRGYVTLHWNPELQRLEFDGDVTDPELIKSIRRGERPYVSLAAQPTSFDTYHGYTVPLGLDFFSLSAVKDPGIPETTLHMERLMEGFYGTRESKLVVVEGYLNPKEDLPQQGHVIFSEPMSKSATKMLHAMKSKYGNDKGTSYFYGTLAKMGKKDTDDLSSEECESMVKEAISSSSSGAASSVDYGQRKENSASPHNGPYTSTAGTARGADTYQGPWSTTPRTLADGSGVYGGQDEYRTSPALGVPPENYQDDQPTDTDGIAKGSYKAATMKGALDQKPGVQVALQHSDGETSGVEGGWADGSQPVKKAQESLPITSKEKKMSAPNQPVSESIKLDTEVAALKAENTQLQIEALRRANKKLREGIGDAAGAQDDTVVWPNKKAGSDGSDIKHIGLPATPFEGMKEEETKVDEEEEARGAGSTEIPDPNTMPTASNTTRSAAFPDKDNVEESDEFPSGGTTGTSKAVGDQGGDVSSHADSDAQGEPKEASGGEFPRESSDPYHGKFVNPKIGTGTLYGYTKETWSTLSKNDKRMIKEFWEAGGRAMFERAFTLGRRSARLERSGVRSRTAVGPRRESRDGGNNVVKSGIPYGARNTDGTFAPKFGQTQAEFISDIDFKIENMNEHADVVRGRRIWAASYVPTLGLPKLGTSLQPRLEFLNAVQSWGERVSSAKTVLEAAPSVTTSTTGAAIGVEEMTPALVVPTNLAALLRDTYLYKALPQGTDRARFQTVTALTMGALTQNTAPSSTAPTLATVDVTTAPRGYLLQLSFEAERRVIGPLLDALILAGRLGELYDEDYLSVGAGQAFESATIPTTGGLYGTGNQIFGTGVASESAVTSSMTMSLNVMTDMQETIKAEGYSPDNVVIVLAPKQFRDLMRDSNLVRYVSFGVDFNQTQSMMGQGVIPQVLGMEIRQSTLPVQRASGSGSPATETYHAWAYKKGLTAALAASRDVMIETFRDIEAGSTWLKVHYDMGVAVLHPNSLVEAVTA